MGVLAADNGDMMRRIISLLLIPVLLASQWCVTAHTHADMNIVESIEHSARPHVHVHGVHDHHHGSGHSHCNGPQDSHKHSTSEDQSSRFVANDSNDHDADAVYRPDSVTTGMSFEGRTDVPTSTVSAVKHLSTLEIWDRAGIVVVNRQNLPPPFLGQTCPLFLRNLSIRC